MSDYVFIVLIIFAGIYLIAREKRRKTKNALRYDRNSKSGFEELTVNIKPGEQCLIKSTVNSRTYYIEFISARGTLKYFIHGNIVSLFKNGQETEKRSFTGCKDCQKKFRWAEEELAKARKKYNKYK